MTGQAWSWLRGEMTSGQRWTAALGAAFVVWLLAAGLPDRVALVGAPAAPAEGAAAASAPDLGALTPTTVPLVDALIPSSPPPSPSRAPSSGSGAGPAPGDADAGSPPPVVADGAGPVVVAAVNDEGDAALAGAYFEEAGIDATAVVDDTSATVERRCEALAAPGDVVVSALDLDPELLNCLLDAGTAVVGRQGLPTDLERGLLSTSRGTGPSLVDLAGWASSSVDGEVGLVAGARDRPLIEPVLQQMAEAGLSVDHVAWIADTTDVFAGVATFAIGGVDTVVFAADVEVQRQWLDAAVPGLATAYLVADAGDAILGDEQYAAGFDGARAHTSLRLPWEARDAGRSTPVQEACAGVATAVTGEVGAAGLARAYGWCQHASIVARALAGGARTGAAIIEAGATFTVASPVTSDLAPLRDGWGPSEDAVLVWSAECVCWRGEEPFRPRG